MKCPSEREASSEQVIRSVAIWQVLFHVGKKKDAGSLARSRVLQSVFCLVRVIRRARFMWNDTQNESLAPSEPRDRAFLRQTRSIFRENRDRRSPDPHSSVLFRPKFRFFSSIFDFFCLILYHQNYKLPSQNSLETVQKCSQTSINGHRTDRKPHNFDQKSSKK